jgi:hypothetical protein
MKSSRGYIVLGVVLIVIGALALFQNMGIFNFVDLIPIISLESGGLLGTALVSLLFAGIGLAFLIVFVTNLHRNWWAVIPGFTLMGLAALIAFGNRMGEAGAGMFLAAIGLSFLAIYLVRRDFWWAIIPAGVLLTLAIMLALGPSIFASPTLTPAILFFGLAATFFLVFLLPAEDERRKWALIPAAVLAGIGLLLLLSLGNLVNYIWATALILGGGYLVLRAARR